MLHRVRLWNFCIHQDTSITLDSDHAIFVGPNGSGKSTIFQAVYLALRTLRTHQVIRKEEVGCPTGEEVVVKVVFKLDPNISKLCRSFLRAVCQAEPSLRTFYEANQEFVFDKLVLGLKGGPLDTSLRSFCSHGLSVASAMGSPCTTADEV